MLESLKSKVQQSGLFISTSDSRRYIKMSFEGFAGAGKTETAARVVIGIWEHEGKKSPVLMIDTEESAKFLIPLFAKAGIVEGEHLFVSRSRSLADWNKILKIAEDEQAIFLTDSVTHIYEEMQTAYRKSKSRKPSAMEEARVLKPIWKEQFSVPFVRAQCHAIFTGRATWEYEAEKNEETGKIEGFNKSGIKMRGDNETAFEPDHLSLMSRCQEVNNNDLKVWREALVVKSRYQEFDGKVFKNPTFKDFEPLYNFVMTGSAARPKQHETPVEVLFEEKAPVARVVQANQKQQGLLLAIQDVLAARAGTGPMARSVKAELCAKTFGERVKTWDDVKALDEADLKDGLNKLRLPPSEEKPKAEVKLTDVIVKPGQQPFTYDTADQHGEYLTIVHGNRMECNCTPEIGEICIHARAVEA
jgi:hypothetical protein